MPHLVRPRKKAMRVALLRGPRVKGLESLHYFDGICVEILPHDPKDGYGITLSPGLQDVHAGQVCPNE